MKLVITTMTVLCAAAVAFYARFFVALCRESNPRVADCQMQRRRADDEARIHDL
jgi:hypothetical protein